jgi:PTS system beta-glucosides-specific IIC component
MLIGPLVSFVGGGINSGINALMNTVPVLAGVLFGGLYQVMILFGVHSALTSFSFMNLLSGQPDYIMAIACTVSFAQIGVVLGMMLKTKDEGLKEVALPAFISGIFGVTEPAIYGVTLPHIKMFILSCLGGALTGALTMISSTKLYAFTGLGVFTFFGFISPEQPGFLWPILIMAVPFLVSFALAYVLFKDETQTEAVQNQDAEAETAVPEIKGRFEIEAPVPGKVVALSEVLDATFAEGLLGNGIAVEPSEGKVYAPFDGTAETVFETLHALGLKADNGVTVLIHVGLETVGLGGAPFKAHIKQGEHFKKGQLLLEFDMDQIKAAGLPTITPVIVTNEDEVGDVAIEDGKIVIGA